MKYLNSIKYILLSLLLVMCIPISVNAQDEYELIIKDKQMTNTTYQIWSLSETYPMSKERIAEISETLSNVSEADLMNIYPIVQTIQSSNGEVSVANLPKGTYYIKDVTNRSWHYAPIVLNFPFDLTTTQQVLYTKQYPEVGNILLQKWGYSTKQDTNKKALSHVTFELYRKGENKPLRFNAHGQLTTNTNDSTQLITDDNGQIYVHGLSPGEYYFKEIKTVENYDLLQNNIEVAVNNTKTVKVSVNNYKTPPKNPWLPQTGEQIMWASSIIGVLLLVIAFIIIKRNKKDDNNNKEEQ